MRNRLILLDIFTDIFCVRSHFSILGFLFGIPVETTEMLLIVVYPTLSVLTKLNDIWGDYFKMDLSVRTNRKTTTKLHTLRKRMSSLGCPTMDILDMQLKHFPKWLRYVLRYLISVLCFFLSA